MRLLLIVGCLMFFSCATQSNDQSEVKKESKRRDRVRIYAGDSCIGDWITDNGVRVFKEGLIRFYVNEKEKMWTGSALIEDTLMEVK